MNEVTESADCYLRALLSRCTCSRITSSAAGGEWACVRHSALLCRSYSACRWFEPAEAPADSRSGRGARRPHPALRGRNQDSNPLSPKAPRLQRGPALQRRRTPMRERKRQDSNLRWFPTPGKQPGTISLSDTLPNGGGRGIRTPKSFRTAVFKTAALRS